MTALQLAFESRVLVRSVRSDPNFDNVMSLLKSSTKDELAARCPATDASLLFYAAQRKNDGEAEQICRYLCEDVAVCDPSKSDRNSQTSLFFAARDGNAQCLKYLVSKGCSPDHRDSALQTALFYAARDGRTDCVVVLLDCGADVNAADHLGQTALFYASRDGRIDTVARMLEKGASTSVKDRQRRTALYYAQKSNQKELVTLLKSATTISGSATPTKQSSQIDGSSPDLEATPDEGPPAKRPRLASNELASPHVSPSSLPAPHPSLTPSQSAEAPIPPTKRRCYRLVMVGFPCTDGEFQSVSAPNDQIARFEHLVPSVAVWPKTNPSPVTDIFYDIRSKWQLIANSIMDELTVLEGGWIFSKPVDCKAWGCPDYYEVIQHPMDYSTMRKKMKNQQYRKCSEFLADMALVFANCFRYNKPDSPVAAIGKNIEKVFRELIRTKELQIWIDRENVIEQWYTSREDANNHTNTASDNPAVTTTDNREDDRDIGASIPTEKCHQSGEEHSNNDSIMIK